MVTVNGKAVKLLSLSRLSTQQLEVDGQGAITVNRLDPIKQERTMRLKGIAWWVNRRMVGEPSWDGIDGPGQYLDGRTVEARRFSFVVEADILGGETKPDWTGFKETPKVAAVRKSVHAFITDQLRGLMANDRKTLKKSAIQQHRYLIQQLPPISQRQIGKFIDEVQERCPHVTPEDLSRTIEILGKLEQGRSGYDLLKQLWMFGPEFESVEFTSNRSMTTVVRKFFERRDVDASRSRPDFVVLPDSSVGLYCADEFTNGEVSGTRKILIIELKRGGFCLSQNELDQARDYAKELRTTGCAQPATEIEAYVLGASLEPTLQEMKIGERTLVRPCPYDLILNRAHARTFNLQKRIQETAPLLKQDEEITDALADSSFDFEGGDS